ncbi:MAG: radical SAM protein [Candidatus ainarchaeum sp.]|nr:radical SAM protein [Candidatus ainarchaeum sp.]
MNILLVKLNAEADEIIPPVGLGYLASAVRKSHNVEILDCLKENMNLRDFLGFLQGKKIDLIGFLFFSMNYEQIKSYSKAIKEKFPGIFIAVGGPHPSALPRETLEEIQEIDFAFLGEAELGFAQLADVLAKKKFFPKDLEKVFSLAWRNKGKIVLNPKKILENIDDVGLPAWDLLKPEAYPQAPHGSFSKQFPTAPIIITRGCPYSCTFCGGSLVSGKRIRYRGLDSVIEEIELLVKKHCIREIHIEDDNFTMNKDFVEKFCKALIKKNFGITWACPNGVRLDTLDRELLLLMKKSGLYVISVGIESGSDRILKSVKKVLTTKQIREKIELIDSIGFDVIGFVMLGFPTETEKEIEKTIDFVCSLPLKRINFSCLQPFPGTEIYANLIENHEIEKVSWSNCFLFKANYAPKGLSIEKLRALRKKGLRKFYLRPKILFSILIEIKNPKQFYYAARRGIRWLLLA